MRTCPTSGLGISRSTIWKSAPALGTCATFIGAIATFVVPINPPLNFQTLLKGTYCCLQGERTLLAAPVLPFMSPRELTWSTQFHSCFYLCRLASSSAFSCNANHSTLPLRILLPVRPACRAEGLRRHTPG